MADAHQSAANLKPLIAEINPTDLTVQHFAEVASQRTPFARAALHIKHHALLPIALFINLIMHHGRPLKNQT